MKKITTILLAGMLVLAGAGLLVASDDRSEGYRGKYYGIVEAMPSGYTGTWTVNGRSVEVGSQTKIEEEYGRAAVGAYVEVKGRTNGQVFQAYELEVKRSGHDKRNDDAYHRNGSRN
jgi:hypothetical protein